jgi:enamine deaminase RidA (YjgF/YER057c/UK114 family)
VVAARGTQRTDDCDERRTSPRYSGSGEIVVRTPPRVRRWRDPAWRTVPSLIGKNWPVIERTNPPGLHKPPGYHHVIISDATRLVFLAGQCPLDEQGQLIGLGDLQAQVGQVARNIMIALSSVGAVPAAVVRTVIYVVSADRSDLAAVWTALRSSPVAEALTSASTLLGVAQLGFPGQLVEIDVTAALSV